MSAFKKAVAEARLRYNRSVDVISFKNRSEAAKLLAQRSFSCASRKMSYPPPLLTYRAHPSCRVSVYIVMVDPDTAAEYCSGMLRLTAFIAKPAAQKVEIKTA